MNRRPSVFTVSGCKQPVIKSQTQFACFLDAESAAVCDDHARTPRFVIRYTIAAEIVAVVVVAVVVVAVVLKQRIVFRLRAPMALIANCVAAISGHAAPGIRSTVVRSLVRSPLEVLAH